MINPARTTLLFAVRFLILAPLCLVGWLLLLPRYTWLLGEVTSFILRTAFRLPVKGFEVKKEGLLNTGTALAYQYGEIVRTLPEVGMLVTNVAPFIALTLATPKLSLLRRVKIILIGTSIIMTCHIAAIVSQFISGKTAFQYALGLVTITLPFVLWILLAYWDNVLAYFEDDEPAAKDEG